MARHHRRMMGGNIGTESGKRAKTGNGKWCFDATGLATARRPAIPNFVFRRCWTNLFENAHIVDRERLRSSGSSNAHEELPVPSFPNVKNPFPSAAKYRDSGVSPAAMVAQAIEA